MPFLKRIKLFAPLPSASLTRLAEVSGLQRFEEGSFLFHEGEEPGFIYSFIEGGAALLGGSDGQEAVVEFFGTGQTILLASAILGLPYLVSAKATSEGQALLVPAACFRQFLDVDNALAAECARVLSRHWRLLVSQIKEIKTRGAAERLAHYLLSQANGEHGEAALVLPGMKKDIATRIGIKPATLSRAIKKLRDYGVVIEGDSVRIQSVDRLAALVGAHPASGTKRAGTRKG